MTFKKRFEGKYNHTASHMARVGRNRDHLSKNIPTCAGKILK
jgi:hypothetical protein